MCVTRGCKLFLCLQRKYQCGSEALESEQYGNCLRERASLGDFKFHLHNLTSKKININEANSKMILSRMWQFKTKTYFNLFFLFSFLKDMPIN